MSRGVAIVLVVAALFVATASAGPRATGGGTIVFAADGSPSLFGEIYRVDRAGRRVDLSRSPARDLAPAVSPDGRLVAFSSNRGGRLALYTVRLDGTHLRRVSGFFGSGVAALAAPSVLSWSPDGGRLVAVLQHTTSAELWAGGGNGFGRVLARGDVRGAAWAPAGRELAWLDGAGVLHVVSPSGKRLWEGVGTTLAWSATGRLAVSAPGAKVVVYDASGRRLATLAAGAYAWSPDGRELATLGGRDQRRLQVRSGGAGRPLVDVRVPARNGSLEWLGSRRLRISTGSGWTGYDVSRRRPWRLPAALAAFGFPDAPSSSGAAVAVTRSTRRQATLAVAALDGRVGRPLASAPVCGSDSPFESLQFTPDGRSLVYQDDCFSPPADLRSIRPDGAGLRRVATTATDETAPSVSPDGTRIAYAEQDAGECKGCTQTVWEMNADGGGRHALTAQTAQTSVWSDAAPSFSPDGAGVVYSHWQGDANEIFAVPAAGGAPQRLPVTGGDPAWGATRIAFYASSKSAVETVLPDGSQPVVVASAPRFVGGLAWAHDGRLAWLEQRGGLVLAVADGTHLARHALGALREPYRGTGLAWSPDGRRLAFTACDAAEVCDLWTVAAGGGALRRLTHGLGAISGPAWTGG